MQGSKFNRVPTEDDMKIAFWEAYRAMVECLKGLSGQIEKSSASVNHVNKLNENYLKLNTWAIIYSMLISNIMWLYLF